MKYLASLLLIGFIAMGIFSFTFTGHSENHAAGNCIASSIDKAACPQNNLIIALRHINAYQIFSQVIITPLFSVSLTLFLLFAAGFFFLKVFFSKCFSILFNKYKRRLQNNQELSLHQLWEAIKWLSLLENSPSIR